MFATEPMSFILFTSLVLLHSVVSFICCFDNTFSFWTMWSLVLLIVFATFVALIFCCAFLLSLSFFALLQYILTFLYFDISWPRNCLFLILLLLQSLWTWVSKYFSSLGSFVVEVMLYVLVIVTFLSVNFDCIGLWCMKPLL